MKRWKFVLMPGLHHVTPQQALMLLATEPCWQICHVTIVTCCCRAQNEQEMVKIQLIVLCCIMKKEWVDEMDSWWKTGKERVKGNKSEWKVFDHECLRLAMPDKSRCLLSLQLESLFAVSQQELEMKLQELEETNMSLQTTQKALATTEKVRRLILVRRWM